MKTVSSLGADEIAPFFLHYQEKWLLDRSPVKVGEKSRRVGLTYVTAYEAVEVASTAASDGGSNVWYQTYAEDDAKEFIEDCAKFARSLDLAFSSEEEILSDKQARKYFILPEGERSIKVTSIRFSSGHRITSLPHLPRKLRGKGGVYILDEAAFHDDIHAALKAAHAFRMWGGRVIILSTHNGLENGFNQLVEEIKRGTKKYSLHTITLINAVDQGLYRKICEVRGIEWTQKEETEWVEELLATDGADEEFLCIPSRSTGQYFPPALVQNCMDKEGTVIRLALPDDFLLRPEVDREDEINAWLAANVLPQIKKLPSFAHYYGQDFGRTSDLSVISPATLYPNNLLKIPFTVELRNVPFETQRQIAFYIIDNLPLFTFAAFDATGNGAYLGEVALQNYGETQVEPISITDTWYNETLPAVLTRIEEAEISFPWDLDIRQDFSMFTKINGVPKLPKIRLKSARPEADKKEKRHGDTGIAVACVVHAVLLHDAQPMEYEATGMRTDEAPPERWDEDKKRSGHWGMKGLW
jgi:phage FluMu gp28-like protein